MPGADVNYSGISHHDKIIQFKDYISNKKYSGVDFTESDLLTMKKMFEGLIPYRLEYFECEREVLENFDKIAKILDKK